MTALLQINVKSFGIEGALEYMEKRISRFRKKLAHCRSKSEFEILSDLLDIWEGQLKEFRSMTDNKTKEKV
jgi:CII-binding regulator of phage lambda lysogenization HflD